MNYLKSIEEIRQRIANDKDKLESGVFAVTICSDLQFPHCPRREI